MIKIIFIKNLILIFNNNLIIIYIFKFNYYKQYMFKRNTNYDNIIINKKLFWLSLNIMFLLFDFCTFY